MDTDAKLHAPVERKAGVAGLKRALYLDGGAYRVESARELGEEVVPRRVDHPAPMLEDEAGEVFAMGLQGLDRRDLVLRHEAAVADRVGAQDSREPANDGVGVHRAAWRSSEHQREARGAVGSTSG
jgi:hypothetical protein